MLAMTTVLAPYKVVIACLLQAGRSYEDISHYLCRLNGQSRRGFSPRSIRRFCSSRGWRLHSALDDISLDSEVATLVGHVGHSYGRRSMHRLLRSLGHRVNQSRVAASLHRIAPIQHSARQHSTYQLLNPFPYQAHYFGDKLHLDQNEKCVMFGVTHVLAIDGYSRKIVGFITIPKKTPIHLLFRPLLLSH